MRVARTETNIAYRRADHERWQEMDFVLGQRIQLSRSHPKKDICDKLAGDYPKDFVFDGWHPQCFCFVTPITIPPEETEHLTDMMLNGEDWRGELARLKRGREITSYPDNFKQWISDNAENIAAARERGTEPYFIRNNKILHPKEEKALTPQQIAEKRHAERTPEDIDKIQQKWDQNRMEHLADLSERIGSYQDKELRELFTLLEKDNDLLDYGAFKADYNLAKQYIENKIKSETELVKKLLENPVMKANLQEVAKVLGVDISSPMTFYEANQLRGNPHYAESEAYRVNCQTCVVANELRRRGFNIEALANTKGSALEKLSHHTESAWLDTDGNIPTSSVAGLRKVKRKRWDGTEYDAWEKTAKNRKQIVTALESAITENGRYHIKWTWARGNCGHIITAERINGKIRYYDPQNGRVIDDFVGYINGIKTGCGIQFLRVDNLRVNPAVAKGVLTKPTTTTTTGTAAKGGTAKLPKERRNQLANDTRKWGSADRGGWCTP